MPLPGGILTAMSAVWKGGIQRLSLIILHLESRSVRVCQTQPGAQSLNILIPIVKVVLNASINFRIALLAHKLHAFFV
jgi:hypothetical protein